MRSYFKYIVYFTLSVIDSLVNLVASLFYTYPGFDMSGRYLASRELRKTLKWDINHQMLKQSRARTALEQLEKAKRDSGV